MKKFLLLAIVSATVLPTHASAAGKSLGEKIVAFCKANVDKQVGDGECTALAKGAFEAAGAKPRTKYRDSPNKGDYVWGKLVFYIEAGESEQKRTGKERDIQPGDVIQFRDAKFEWKKGKNNHSRSCAHHTAVVAAVEDDGKTMRILHQNTNGKRFVVEATISFAHLKKGWMRVYRPNPK